MTLTGVRACADGCADGEEQQTRSWEPGAVVHDKLSASPRTEGQSAARNAPETNAAEGGEAGMCGGARGCRRLGGAPRDPESIPRRRRRHHHARPTRCSLGPPTSPIPIVCHVDSGQHERKRAYSSKAARLRHHQPLLSCRATASWATCLVQPCNHPAIACRVSSAAWLTEHECATCSVTACCSRHDAHCTPGPGLSAYPVGCSCGQSTPTSTW
jgi:hypothetical protein